MTIGIYCIRNMVNNKVYIGRSINIEKRWKQYWYCYRKQSIKQINDYLIKSMNKHCYENFEFTIIEKCNIDELVEKELYWILCYDSCDNLKGYNLRLDTMGGLITHPLTSEKISNRLKTEWASGARSLHSEKLKDSWARGDRDKSEQSNRMSDALTKYKYIITDEFGQIVVNYKQLKELNLHGVLGKFHKQKCNKVIFKSYTIERVLFNE